MAQPIRRALRWVTVAYTPRPDERPFLERAQTQKERGLEVTAAVLSDHESTRFFGVRLARRGMQPVWIHIVNRTDQPVRLDLFSIDPAYYTPLEAAYVNHFSPGKHLAGFGLLAWMYLPLLPLVPFKFFGARSANRRMDAFFKEHGFRTGPIRPGDERSGLVFTALDEGRKDINVKLVAEDHAHAFAFTCEIPGLTLRAPSEDTAESGQVEPVDEAGLRAWIERQPHCTTNRHGGAEGDPVNLVVVGDRDTVLQCFGSRWDEAETLTPATGWKTVKAFFLDSQYRNMPVSPLYLAGRQEDLALQRARARINERNHLRLWRAPISFEGQRVWIGQISRDIGVRFTLKTWNLTTHKIDPDVDEARDYAVDCLMATGRLDRIGYVTGLGAVSPSAPRHNLTGDPYFTDGLRAILILSKHKTEARFFSWT